MGQIILAAALSSATVVNIISSNPHPQQITLSFNHGSQRERLYNYVCVFAYVNMIKFLMSLCFF